MDLNIKQMKELIDLFERSNLSEINVQQDEFKVTLKKDSAGDVKALKDQSELQEPEKQGSRDKVARSDRRAVESDEGEASEEKSEEEAAITSPIVGTFYRSPSPEEAPYIEVGDEVEKGDTVCIVEAMKVMNEVKADRSGRITDVCVQEGDSVEYGQELFKLALSDEDE